MRTSRAFLKVVSLAAVMSLLLVGVAIASNLDTDAVLDSDINRSEATIEPGGSVDVSYAFTVSGPQAEPASFSFNRHWTLEDGEFHGEGPEDFEVPARAGGDADTVLRTSGTISVADGTAAGEYELEIDVHDLETAAGGRRLQRRQLGTFTVTVPEGQGDQDETAPVIGYTVDPADPDGDNGWYTSDVALTWDVTEDESPESLTLDGCEDQSITDDQQATTYRCAAESDGGQSGPVEVTIKRDATAPDLARDEAADSCDEPGDNGWCRGEQTAGFEATDATSGFDADGTGTHRFTRSTSDEGHAVLIASGDVSDHAGNTASGIDAGPFKIDATAPHSITFEGIGEGDEFYFGSAPDEDDLSCDAVDDLSGLAGCEIDGHSSEVGEHTLIATARDAAGNTATAELTYEVLPWTFDGFHRPVRPDVNKVKGGQAVPLKFNVYAGPVGENEVTDPGEAIKRMRFDRIACDGSAASSEITEQPTAGGTELRYSDDQFVYNWKTPRVGNVCYEASVLLADGVTTIDAVFELR